MFWKVNLKTTCIISLCLSICLKAAASKLLDWSWSNCGFQDMHQILLGHVDVWLVWFILRTSLLKGIFEHLHIFLLLVVLYETWYVAVIVEVSFTCINFKVHIIKGLKRFLKVIWEILIQCYITYIRRIVLTLFLLSCGTDFYETWFYDV